MCCGLLKFLLWHRELENGRIFHNRIIDVLEGKSDMWMDGVFCCCYSSSMITHVSHMCNAYLPLLQCWTVEICVESNLKWSLTTNSNLSAYILLLLNASLLRTLVWSAAPAGL